MAILDFLKKPKKEEKKTETGQAVKKASEKIREERKKTKAAKKEKPEEKEEKLPTGQAPGAKKETRFKQAYRILKSPAITERATDLSSKDQYVFKVLKEANKTEVKKAVQSVYGVKVLTVRIINVPKKRRRMRRQVGWRKGYKKAIVKIEKGQKIEILPR